MAIPDEPPDEVDANAASPVALATASAMTADSLATLATGAAETAAEATTTPLTVSANDTAAIGAAEVSVSQEDVAGAAVFHLYATSTLHSLDSEEYESGDQQVLAPIENCDAGAQQPSREPHESPVGEASAAVVPTPVTAFLELNRIRDEISGITRRRNSIIGLSPSPLSSTSEDSETSRGEDDAIGGVTKRNCCKSLEENASKDQLSSGTSVDVSSVKCCICYDRYKDSVCCPCGHMGCHLCIVEWLTLSIPPSSCHICRQHVETVLTPIGLCNFLHEPRFTN